MLIDVEMAAEDGLSKAVWRFHVRTPVGGGGRLELRLDRYQEYKRKSRRHKFVPFGRFYNRIPRRQTGLQDFSLTTEEIANLLMGKDEVVLAAFEETKRRMAIVVDSPVSDATVVIHYMEVGDV